MNIYPDRPVHFNVTDLSDRKFYPQKHQKNFVALGVHRDIVYINVELFSYPSDTHVISDKVCVIYVNNKSPRTEISK